MNRFIELEREKPSHFRQAYLQIIKNHSMLRASDAFNDLANTVASVNGWLRAPTEPPVRIP